MVESTISPQYATPPTNIFPLIFKLPSQIKTQISVPVQAAVGLVLLLESFLENIRIPCHY